MFAALMVARLRQVVFADAGFPECPSLRQKRSWVSPDDVPASRLPLAKATEQVLASMHDVLQRTMLARNAELSASAAYQSAIAGEDTTEIAKQRFLRETKAAEVRLVRNVRFLQQPETEFSAVEWAPENIGGDR